MKDEYIIINRTVIQKRIEELENKRDDEHKKGHDKSALRYENTILELKQILSQSTPLIPEIEKAIDYGIRKSFGSKKHSEIRQNYISNLKLDKGFIDGAMSKYVEKQKLEFAISLLLKHRASSISEIDNKVFELEEQLYKL